MCAAAILRCVHSGSIAGNKLIEKLFFKKNLHLEQCLDLLLS